MPTNGAQLLEAAVELLASSGRSGTLAVRGTSMMPSLRPGQRLAVDFSPGRLTPGALLLFRQADYLTVHRLLGAARPSGAGESRLRTRGDGVLGLDPPLDPARVLGRVTAVEDDQGWWYLGGVAGRAYARVIAWHDLFWAAAGNVARSIDRRLGAARGTGRLSAGVRRIDHALLTLVHRTLFHVCHRRAAEISAACNPSTRR